MKKILSSLCLFMAFFANASADRDIILVNSETTFANDWSTNVTIDQNIVADIKSGDVLTAVITAKDSTSEWPQMSIQSSVNADFTGTNQEGKGKNEYNILVLSNPGFWSVNIFPVTVTFVFADCDITAMQVNKSLIVSGADYTLSKLVLTKKGEDVTNLSTESKTGTDWNNSGNLQIEKDKFANAKVGDKVVVNVSALDDATSNGHSIAFQNGSWSSFSEGEKSTWINKGTSTPVTATLTLTESILSEINSTGQLIIKGYYCTFDRVDLITSTTAKEQWEVTICDFGYATLCVPFPVTVPEGVTAYVASESNTTTITMKPVASGTVLPVGTPVVLIASANTYNFNRVNSGTNTLEGKNLLTGTLAATPVSNYVGQTVYALTKDTKNNKVVFAKVGSEVSNIPANKAIYVVETTIQGEAAKSISIDFDGETTMVEGIVDGANTDNGTYYNIGGQRVGNPRKGLYIKNNKKVVINK